MMAAAAAAATDERRLQLIDGACEPSSTPSFLTMLSYVVERLVARNDGLVDDGLEEASWNRKNLSVFNGVRAPAISIPKYLERIYKYTNCSPSCFVVGYAYVDRLVHRHPQSLVVSLNVHRLLLTSVMVASKILDDEHYNNAFYARVGGVSNADLNRLELELLFMLDFDVTVSYKVFESYCLHLEKEMKCNGALQTVERALFTNGIHNVNVLSIEDQEDIVDSSSL
uniref:Cyclin n=1 Tax=Kalanchoe fedtschenkoi TaxID=63787 RepID=A0A7N0RJM9_KALFE